MKTRITAMSDTHVILHTDDGNREFWASPSGSYVREIDEQHPGTLGRQVCSRLASMGDTLWLDEGRQLIDLIRREYHKAARQAKADDNY